MSKNEETTGKWLGRKPKGQQDTHSFKAFLQKTSTRQLEEHLARHHKGLSRKAMQ